MPSCACISGPLAGREDGLDAIHPGLLRCEVLMRHEFYLKKFRAVRDFPLGVRVSRCRGLSETKRGPRWPPQNKRRGLGFSPSETI